MFSVPVKLRARHAKRGILEVKYQETKVNITLTTSARLMRLNLYFYNAYADTQEAHVDVRLPQDTHVRFVMYLLSLFEKGIGVLFFESYCLKREYLSSFMFFPFFLEREEEDYYKELEVALCIILLLSILVYSNHSTIPPCRTKWYYDYLNL